MVEGKGFVGHVFNNRALLQHPRVQNAAEHGTPRNQAQPGFCRCPAGEALLCGPRRRSPGRGDPPRLPGWERVVGDGRHLPEGRPAALDQPVSNSLAFSGSPHATLRFPKLLVAGAKPRRVLPRAGAITSRFESLESSGGVETNELPLAPRNATRIRVSALRGRALG